AAAHALLADRRIDLSYEAFGSTVGGPDFAVSFRSHPALTVEVTRWRGDPAALERQLLAKLRQLPTGVANLVRRRRCDGRASRAEPGHRTVARAGRGRRRGVLPTVRP